MRSFKIGLASESMVVIDFHYCARVVKLSIVTVPWNIWNSPVPLTLLTSLGVTGIIGQFRIRSEYDFSPETHVSCTYPTDQKAYQRVSILLVQQSATSPFHLKNSNCFPPMTSSTIGTTASALLLPSIIICGKHLPVCSMNPPKTDIKLNDIYDLKCRFAYSKHTS